MQPILIFIAAMNSFSLVLLSSKIDKINQQLEKINNKIDNIKK